MNTSTTTTVEHDDDVVVIRLGPTVDVRHAATTRRELHGHISRQNPATPIVVTLDGVRDLDTAGLAAVTAPVIAARRNGAQVSILPPASGDARRVADSVGILPLGSR